MKMNEQLFVLINDVVCAQLEIDPEFIAAIAEHNRSVAAAKGSMSRDMFRVLEDSFFEGGRIFGRAMFEMGLQLGRNPNAIFDLPETDGAGNLKEGIEL